jgi:AsmA protein
MLDLDFKGDDLPGGVFATRVDVVGSVDLARQVAEIKRFSGTVYEVELDATFKGTQISENPTFTGTVKTAEFAPDKLIEKLTGAVPDTADESVLKRASLDLDLMAGTNSVAVSRLVAVLDDTNLTGTAEVSDFAKQSIKFDLNVDKLDLDRYLSPAPEPPPAVETMQDPKQEAEKPATPAAKKGKNGQDPDLTPLRALNLRGAARVQALRVRNVDLADAVLRVKALDGQIRIAPVRAALYGGVARADLGLNVKQNRPRLSADIKVKNIQAEPLLDDLTGEAVLTGKGGFTANLSAVGLSEEQIKRTLNGNLAFVFRNGAIKGINVAHIFRQAQAVLKGQPPPPATGPNQTDFAELKASARSTNGLLVNQDLQLKAPLIRVRGEGKAYLPDDKVDYKAFAAVVNTLEGEGGREFADLEGLEIPVLIDGQLSDPSIRPDYEAIARAEAQRQLEKHGDEIQKQAEERLKDQLGEDVGGQVGDMLKGFIKKSE